MAVIDPSATIEKVRNATGDVVYYISQGRQLSRSRVTPANTATAARTRVRNNLAALTAAWNGTLTEAQREAWRAAARDIGPRPHRSGYAPLSGWQYFHGVNLTRLNLSLALFAAPPSRQTPDPVLSLTVDTLDATTQTIKLNCTGATGAHTYLVIYATGNRTAGQTSANGTTRQVAVIAPAASRPFDISSDWLAKFGTLGTASRVVFQAAAANALDGTLSPRMYATAISTGAVDAMQLISSQTLASAAASVAFSSIPGTYRHLWLTANMRGDHTGGGDFDGVNLSFNSDFSHLYDYAIDKKGGANTQYANANQSALTIAQVASAPADANRFTPLEILIPDYTSTAFFKNVLAKSVTLAVNTVSADMFQWRCYGQYRSLSPITSMVFGFGGGFNFVAGTTFDLYGIS